MLKERKVQTERRVRSFALLKELSIASLLVLPNLDKLFEINCDVSDKGIRTILSQEGQPIKYMSEKLNEAR